jgi:hypothetical protein
MHEVRHIHGLGTLTAGKLRQDAIKALLQASELGRIQNRLIEDRVAFAAIGLDQCGVEAAGSKGRGRRSGNVTHG